MINEYTRIYNANGISVNTIECEIYYSLGGINYFTGRLEPRGYYFSIQPYMVETSSRGITCKSFSAFSGIKDCILPCERQSKKRYETAKAMMDDLINQRLANFLNANGIVLESTDYKESEGERYLS